MAVKQHLSLMWQYLLINLSSALEYRFSFLMSIISMVGNNIVWFVFWMIMFAKFGSIGGWEFKDMLMLYSILWTSWGITGVFLGARGDIARKIENGGADFYLVFPVNVLFHMLISRLSVSSLGDLILGVITAFFVVELKLLPLYISLIFFSSAFMISTLTVAGSMAFFVNRATHLERNMAMSMLTFSAYPFSIFTGIVRIIILTIIPVGFIAGIPVELMQNFDLKMYLFLIGASVVFLVAAVSFFYYGLRRYESGNLMVERI